MIKSLIMFNFLTLSITIFANTHLSIVIGEWPPFNYTNENNQIVGSTTDLVKKVLKQVNISYSIRSYPWARSMLIAQGSGNVMIYSIYQTPERFNKFQWICPLSPPVKTFLYRLESRKDLDISSLSQAKNYRIGVHRNSSTHEFLVKKGFAAGDNLDLIADGKINTRKFLAKRLDFIVETEFSVKQRLKNLNMSTDIVVKALELKGFSGNSVCMAFSLATDKNLIEKIEIALRKIQSKS